MSIKRLRINMPDESFYDVRIGNGALTKTGDLLAALHGPCNVALVTDSNVGPLYGDAVKARLEDAGFSVSVLTLPAGETSKNLSVVQELWNALALLNLSRDDLVVALGGGVVGDIAGFVAATYMRGLAFVQIPTTLLAMVDASIGGKNGINLDAGKNMVGTFAQPVHVVCDTATLSSLSDDEWYCGCAEIAKCAVIDDADFFAWLDENAELLAARDDAVAWEAIVRAVAFKANVIASDELERSGERECLNYGHTLGHAIESLSGYKSVTHGQAVAEGMRFAARLGVETVGTSVDFVKAQDSLLDRMGLPSLSWHATREAIVAKMQADKKVRKGAIRFVLPVGVGQWRSCAVDVSLLQSHLDAWARSKGIS